MRSERLTILVTPEERADIDGKAARLGVTASELVRLAVDGFDVSQTELFLNAIADELEKAVEHMNKTLDETHESVQHELAEMRRERAEARAEAQQRQAA